MPYLTLENDPPIPGKEGVSKINLEKYVPKNRLDSLKRRMRVLPRQKFEEVIFQVLPDIKINEQVVTDPETLQTYNYYVPDSKVSSGLMFYANFLHLFNLVNEDEMKRRGFTDPWKWEEEKMRALYIKQAMGEA